MTLAADLADWTDSDVAAYRLGQALGLFPAEDPELARFREVKHLFYSVDPVGEGLYACLTRLVEAGVLLYDEGGDRFIWQGGPGGN